MTLRSAAVPLLISLVGMVGCGESRAPVPVLPAVEVEPAPETERAENPAYARWAAFPVGATVVQRSITEELGHPDKTTTILTFKLVEKTDDRLVLELKTHTTRYDGLVMDNPSDRLATDRYYRVPVGTKKPSPKDTGKPLETLTISKKTFPCRVVETRDRNEAGEVTSKTWTSDEMPGGLVKSISDTPGVKKRTTIEVTEVRLP